MIQPFDELLKPIQIKELIFLSPSTESLVGGGSIRTEAKIKLKN